MTGLLDGIIESAMKILLAGDIDCFPSLSQALIERGFSVAHEVSGPNALQCARELHPSLVVASLEMPQIDGFELCRLLKTDKQLRDIPCLLFTASSITEQQQRLAVSLGVFQLLCKPEQVSSFLAAIEEVIEESHTVEIPVHADIATVLEGVEQSAIAEYIRKLGKKITVLKKEREDLKQRERQYRRLVEYAHAIPWEMDAKTWRFTFVGPQAVEMLGYPLDAWFEDNFWLNRLYHEDREWALKFCQERTTCGEDHEFEYRMHSADGGILWIHDSVIVVSDQSGPIALRGFMFDVTEQRQRESSLRKLNRALTAVTQVNQLMTKATDEKFMLDEMCRILVNTGGYRLAWIGVPRNDEAKSVQPLAQCGYDEGYIEKAQIVWADNERGRGPTGTAIRSKQTQIIKNILHDPNYQPWRKNALEHGYHSSIALPLLRDSQVMGVLNLYSPLPDAFDADEVNLLEELTNDLTYGINALRTQLEKQRTQEALQDREAKLRRILDSVLDAIVMTDDKGVIQSFNPAAEKIFQYEAAEVMGKKVDVLIPESYFREHDTYILKYKGRGDPSVLGRVREEQGRRKNGEVFPLEISLTESKLPNQHLFTAVIRDLTERKRAEQERVALQAQVQLAQKLQTLGHLTGGIAHDFNNILASVIGYTGLAQTRVTPQQDPKLDSYLKEIYGSAERARELIAQLLAFSRGTDGKRKALQLAPVVNDVVRMVQVTFPATVQCTLEVDENLPTVEIDPVQFHQLVMNLCVNARDALAGQGQILIRLRQVAGVGVECASCHQQTSGGFVELDVSDTGSGIQPEVLVKMFDPFFTTKETGKGTGMGLSMIHGIVHDYGGHILVETAPGVGTTFKLLLPPSDRDDDQALAQEEDRAAEAMVEPLQQRRILVVDDEIALTGFLSELLESRGYEVMAVNDAYDALEIFRKDPYAIDLVLTDQTMPGMTGAEMSTELLNVRSEMPIILTTGFSELIDEDGAKELGIRAYIRKPMETQHLLNTIKALLPET